MTDLRLEGTFPLAWCEDIINDFHHAIRRVELDIFNIQGGIEVAAINSPTAMTVINILSNQLKLPSDPGRCSARLQRPKGEFQLHWHQDYAPMDMTAPVKSRVCWLALSPLDGTRPSLEVAEPVLAAEHVWDERKFLYAPDLRKTQGTVLSGEAGSCWSFSPFAPHRTYIDPGMTQDRYSLDIRFSEEWK